MSHQKVKLVGNKLIYDFTKQNSYTSLLGFGQKEILPSVWAMYAANAEQSFNQSSDNDINTFDHGIWVSQHGMHSSYYLGDYDLNGDVNVNDEPLFINNNGVFSDVQ